MCLSHWITLRRSRSYLSQYTVVVVGLEIDDSQSIANWLATGSVDPYLAIQNTLAEALATI
jgi:hypothetical protein